MKQHPLKWLDWLKSLKAKSLKIPACINWLVVSTPLKNASQIGSSPQVGMNIRNTWNHQLD